MSRLTDLVLELAASHGPIPMPPLPTTEHGVNGALAVLDAWRGELQAVLKAASVEEEVLLRRLDADDELEELAEKVQLVERMTARLDIRERKLIALGEEFSARADEASGSLHPVGQFAAQAAEHLTVAESALARLRVHIGAARGPEA